MLRGLRHAAKLSLAQMEANTGIPAVVLGAYERGDRVPPVTKLEPILAYFGYQLVALPIGADRVRLDMDIVSDLRNIADQLEIRQEA